MRIAPRRALDAVGRRGCRATADASARPRPTGINARDIDSADKGDSAVDDQQLAMVALIDLPTGLRRKGVHRIEFLHLDAGVNQALEEFARRRERAGAVIHQHDFDALRTARDQCVRKLPADIIVLDDVRLHQHVILRGIDRREHCLVSGRPVAQERGAVADDERRVGDGFLECEMAIEDARLLTARFQLVEDLLALLCVESAARRLEPDRRSGARHTGIDRRQRAAAGDEECGDADDQRRDP